MVWLVLVCLKGIDLDETCMTKSSQFLDLYERGMTNLDIKDIKHRIFVLFGPS